MLTGEEIEALMRLIGSIVLTLASGVVIVGTFFLAFLKAREYFQVLRMYERDTNRLRNKILGKQNEYIPTVGSPSLLQPADGSRTRNEVWKA